MKSPTLSMSSDIKRYCHQQGDRSLLFLCRILMLFRRLAEPPSTNELQSDLYVMF